LSSYRWFYNDAGFDPSGNDGRIAIQPGVGTLIFAQPIERDEAYYQCAAYNVVGVAMSDKTNLRVGSELVRHSVWVPGLRIDPLRLMAGCRKSRLNQAPLTSVASSDY